MMAAADPLALSEADGRDEAWLVALDVDGTIIHEDETLDHEVRRAIRAAAERGHEVMLATGRAWLVTKAILDRIGITPEYVVCSNGAVIMRRQGETFGPGAPEYVRAHVETFDPTEVLLRLREQLPDAHYMVERADGRRLFTEWLPDWDRGNGSVATFEELLGGEACRVVLVSPDHSLDEFLRLVDGMGLHQVSYAIGWTAWLDIGPVGVNKATAMERVREWLDWPRSRILVAGDGRNDIEMFQWAALGGRAVAMGQAPEEVRSAAMDVTGTIAEQGLVPVLDGLP